MANKLQNPHHLGMQEIFPSHQSSVCLFVGPSLPFPQQLTVRHSSGLLSSKYLMIGLYLCSGLCLDGERREEEEDVTIEQRDH